MDSANVGALSAPQTLALSALFATRTIGEAAKAAGVGERTLGRWLSEDEQFKRAYREARTQVIQAASTQLASAAAEAVETLREALKCDRPDVRVRAALGILASASKADETDNLAARLEELERRIVTPNGTWPRRTA
jgi:hypothetical protein